MAMRTVLSGVNRPASCRRVQASATPVLNVALPRFTERCTMARAEASTRVDDRVYS